MSNRVYCDGGVVLRNPSMVGGTWAWIQVSESDEIISSSSGCISYDELGSPVTNNFTELLAAVEAMESLPDRWRGTLWTDSRITTGRLTSGRSFSGIPKWLSDRCVRQRRRLRNLAVSLLGGHPTKAELIAGRRRDGAVCSKWNVWCDKECGKQALLSQKRVENRFAVGIPAPDEMAALRLP